MFSGFCLNCIRYQNKQIQIARGPLYSISEQPGAVIFVPILEVFAEINCLKKYVAASCNFAVLCPTWLPKGLIHTGRGHPLMALASCVNTPVYRSSIIFVVWLVSTLQQANAKNGT